MSELSVIRLARRKGTIISWLPTSADYGWWRSPSSHKRFHTSVNGNGMRALGRELLSVDDISNMKFSPDINLVCFVQSSDNPPGRSVRGSIIIFLLSVIFANMRARWTNFIAPRVVSLVEWTSNGVAHDLGESSKHLLPSIVMHMNSIKKLLPCTSGQNNTVCQGLACANLSRGDKTDAVASHKSLFPYFTSLRRRLID